MILGESNNMCLHNDNMVGVFYLLFTLLTKVHYKDITLL